MMTISNAKKSNWIPYTEQGDNYGEWSIKYNNAYNKWKDLSKKEKQEQMEKKILQVLRKEK